MDHRLRKLDTEEHRFCSSILVLPNSPVRSASDSWVGSVALTNSTDIRGALTAPTRCRLNRLPLAWHAPVHPLSSVLHAGVLPL
jgi:hypothetical protein